VRHFILGYLACLATIVAVGIFARAVAQTYLVFPMASYHTERKGYNQINPGLGIERRLDERWSIGAGYYRNSVRKDSLYAGAHYMPWRVGEIRIGTALGVATGYGGLLPMVAPAAVWDGPKLGVAVLVTPPVSGKAMAGVMLRWRLD